MLSILGRLTLLFILAVGLTACEETESDSTAAPPAPPPAVTVAIVQPREVTPSTTFTGRIEARDSVDLRARVSGFLEQRLFEEGARVKEGDLLFEIEKAPYQTTIAEIEATIQRAQATLQRAQIEVDRQTTLVQRQAGAQANLDNALATAGEARGDLLRQQASLQRAELDLSYTDIRAPLAGRIGRANFSVGGLVGPDSGPLATIVAQDPIYVTFPVSQRELLAVREQAAERGTDAGNATVSLRLADGSIYAQTGKLDFIDVRVDPGTDSVDVRADFPNPDGTLVDGQLVTAIVESGAPESALVIPQQALQADQGGLFVLTVDAENKVQVTRVQTGPQIEADIVVTEGLEQGQRVIVEGSQKVRPQQVVDPAEAPAGPAA